MAYTGRVASAVAEAGGGVGASDASRCVANAGSVASAVPKASRVVSNGAVVPVAVDSWVRRVGQTRSVGPVDTLRVVVTSGSRSNPTGRVGPVVAVAVNAWVGLEYMVRIL